MADQTDFSVAELSARIAGVLRDVFPAELWVRGQIRDLSRSRTGHVYFALADTGSDTDPGATGPQLSVVLLARDRERVNRLLRRGGGGNVKMVDGTEVRIRVQLDFYEPRGQLQLRMRSIDPAFTLGQLAAARAELLDRLRADGLVDANRAIPLPLLPLRIGVVTSAGSAAEADVVDQLSASRYAFRVIVADVRVQGPDAPMQVAAAVAGLGRNGVDVIVVARGGGATTDLAAFDSELVARAIATSPVPVVTGVGHETDRSVADEVAHTAAKTPTAAAQIVIGWVADAEQRAETTHAAIVHVARRDLSAAAERLDRDVRRLTTARASATRAETRRIDTAAARLGPATVRQLQRSRDAIDRSAERLVRGAEHLLARRSSTLDVAAARVAAADPARALARGWSMTHDAEGRLVREPGSVEVGAILRTRVFGGTIISTVSDTDEGPTDD